KSRERPRRVKRRTLENRYASRDKSEKGQQKMKAAYGKLLDATSRVVGQAKKFSGEIAGKVKKGQRVVLQKAKQQLDEMIPRVQQVMRQARERVLGGNTRAKNKILSMFEHTTEVIRKGKASKPTEFGKMVKIQEAENQIVIDYEVYEERPSDSALVIPAIEAHVQKLGRPPRLAAGDAAFYSTHNESTAHEKGVKRVCIPNRSTKSAERKREQKKRWFRQGQKWRTGCEGRISVLKRRHGLNRCRYKGDAGMKRWVGLGVIADNLINIGRAMAKQSVP